MKLGFMGSGATGKTTTAKIIAPYLGLEYQSSVPRIVFERRGLNEAKQRNMSRFDRWSLQKEIFEEKLKQDAEVLTGVFDRTLLDHLAYCLYRCSDTVPDNIYSSYLELVRENVTKYDYLFYFPIYDWEIKAGGS